MYIDFYIEELPKDKFTLKEGDTENKVIGLTFDLNTFDTKEIRPVTLWINCPTSEYEKGDMKFLFKALEKGLAILQIVDIRKRNE